MEKDFIRPEVLPPEPPDESWHMTARYSGEPSSADASVMPQNRVQGENAGPETIRGIHTPTARGIRTPTMRGMGKVTKMEKTLREEPTTTVPDKVREIEAKRQAAAREIKELAAVWADVQEALQWDQKDMKAKVRKAEIESRLSEIARDFLAEGELRQELDMSPHDEFARFCRESGLEDKDLIDDAAISAGVELSFPEQRDSA